MAIAAFLGRDADFITGSKSRSAYWKQGKTTGRNGAPARHLDCKNTSDPMVAAINAATPIQKPAAMKKSRLMIVHSST